MGAGKVEWMARWDRGRVSSIDMGPSSKPWLGTYGADQGVVASGEDSRKEVGGCTG